MLVFFSCSFFFFIDFFFLLFYCCFLIFFFFFSSRRRHTRFDCDWSSHVCSSDLASNAKSVTAPPDVLPRTRFALPSGLGAIRSVRRSAVPAESSDSLQGSDRDDGYFSLRRVPRERRRALAGDFTSPRAIGMSGDRPGPDDSCGPRISFVGRLSLRNGASSFKPISSLSFNVMTVSRNQNTTRQ